MGAGITTEQWHRWQGEQRWQEEAERRKMESKIEQLRRFTERLEAIVETSEGKAVVREYKKIILA